MTKQIINVGSAEQAGDGESIRSAFIKINENFDELYLQTDGSQGVQGVQGITGTGTQGIQGITGIGIQGTQGIVGSQGIQGIAGSGGSGLTVSDFGRGFTDTLDSGKITTSKLYNRPANQSLNNHFELSVTDGGVVSLPDGSIINGATLKTIAGNYAGITAGPSGRDEDSWVWVDNDGATISTKTSTDNHQWRFNNTGELIFPDNTVQTTAYTGQTIDTTVARQDTPPTASNGTLWYNTIEGRIYIKYDDQWIDAAPLMVPAPDTDLDVVSITFADSSVQTTAFTGTALVNKLTNELYEVVLDENGNLTSANDIIAVPGGRFIKDCGNSTSTTSMRWINLPSNENTEILRAYTGDPLVTGYIERANISLKWQTSTQSGLSITAFDRTYINEEHIWEFRGDGTTQFPNGTIKAPAAGFIQLSDNAGKNFVSVSDTEVVISAEDTTEYNWTFDTNGILTLPLSNYLETSDINLKIGSQGSVTIRSNAETSPGTKTWVFGTDGGLTFPSGAGFIQGDNGQIKTNDGTTLALDLRDASGRGFYTNGDGFSLRGNGSNTWKFDTSGGLTFPNSTVQTTAYVPADNVTKISGTWAVTPGDTTYSFQVPANGVYQLWVRGNIPDGIISYVATAAVTNTNVCVLGTQYAWNYTGAGSPILFTTLPTQFIGTEGAISTSNPSVGTSTNTFVFGIENNTAENVTVAWGYTKIS